MWAVSEMQGLLLELLWVIYLPDDPVREFSRVVEDSILHLEAGDDGGWPSLRQGLMSL